MIGHEEKFSDMSKYKGERDMVIVNNSRSPITHIGKAVSAPWFSSQQVQVDQVYHVLGMKKNLLLISQLTSSSNYVMFKPRDVKLY